MNALPLTSNTTLGGLVAAVAAEHPDWIYAPVAAGLATSSWGPIPVSDIQLGAGAGAPFLTATLGPVDDWAPEYNKTLKLILKEEMNMADETKINMALTMVVEVNGNDVELKLDNSAESGTGKTAGKQPIHLAIPKEGVDVGSLDGFAEWAETGLGLKDEMAAFHDLPDELSALTTAPIKLDEFKVTIPPKPASGDRPPVTFAMGLTLNMESNPVNLVDGKLAVKKASFHIDRSVKS